MSVLKKAAEHCELEHHVAKRVSENTRAFGAAGDLKTKKEDEETLQISLEDSTVQSWSISTPMSFKSRST